MVATKRVPLAEVDNGKERRSVTNEGGPVFEEPLGGFIFVCNNDTMGEDFDRHLFGLPQRYHDSVKAIQPGLPLFLYNYSTRCLHGVFEASSDGGLNIEPDAWGENKEARKNGRQSRFPAQVRVRWREERPPLEEEKFRPVLYHYDGPKFRLQLTKSEAHELLKLFGASPARKIQEVQEDAGGEWEEVKTKSKASRSFRATLVKGNTSPNSSGGRRWGSTVNGSSSNGGATLSSLNNCVHEAVSRGREREIKIDSAQRWRTDSDSWSGSSSAGTTSSNCGSHEEERTKKGTQENGCCSEIIEASGLVFGQGHDGIDGVSSLKGAIHPNGSIDTDHKVEIRHSEVDSNELNNGLGPSSRSGFVSYSAALKSGMLALAAAENGSAESYAPSLTDNATSPNNSIGNRTRNSYSSVANVINGSHANPNGPLKADAAADKIDVPKQKLEVGVNKIRAHGEGLIINHVKLGPQGPLENGKQEYKADQLTNVDGDTKRVPAWGKVTPRSYIQQEVAGGQGVQVGDLNKSNMKAVFDSSAVSKKGIKDGSRNMPNEGETGDSCTSEQGHGSSELKENSAKSLESIVRKNAWQGNDGAVLRLLHDPDPAVNSTAVNGSNTGLRVESEVYEKQEKVAPVQLQLAMQFPVEKIVFLQPLQLNANQIEVSKQLPSRSGAPLSQGAHSKVPQEEVPVLQQSKSVHESRTQQLDHQKHEKHQDDKLQFRKNAHPSENSQPSSPMLQSQQVGQGLVPVCIPTPPPSGMQQHHHHPLLSPAPQAPLYRERSRSRGGNSSVENVHGFAYRPISRNMLDGEVALQNPLVPGSWGLQSPVLLMQPVIPPVTGNFTLPPPSPHMLGNVEGLHAEILEFAQTATPSAETRVHAEAAVESVRNSVKELWPEADVEVFGSFATGLCLHHSDVDVVVVDAPPPPETAATAPLSGARLLIPLIRDLSAALKEFEWCEVLNTIETASMPVIKLRCNPVIEGQPPGPPVAIDVTIGGKRSATFAGVSQVSFEVAGSNPVNPKFDAARNAHNGAAAREFVIERLRQLPALAPLVLLLKSFLRSRGLNDVYSGGLGSFALTLMLVFYLERVPISCGIPQDISRPLKSPSSNLETSISSADISQAPAAAESVDFSDDESTDSSVMTSTSASSIASMDVPAVQGSTSGGEYASSQGGLSHGEPLLRKAGGIVEELLSTMHSVASPNLGTLLVGFLHFFGQEIDFSRVRLVLKGKNGSAGGVFWHEKNARTLPLWIDDPLRPDANIGAGSFNIWQVQAAMREMLSVIIRPQPVANNTLPDSGRSGKGPGRRRHLSLLQQLFANDSVP